MLAIDFGADDVVVIAGRLDAAQCATAQSFLDKIDGKVTLDCSKLDYISSAGKLRLTGVSAHLRDIFVYSGFDQIFEIEPAR